MLLCALTGGIASGKSTVVDMLRQRGAFIIDLDELARVVVEPGRPALDEIKKRFGDGVIMPEGGLDREGLGEIVFNDEQARRDLEAILHPEILREEQHRAAQISQKNPRAIIVVDIPLMIELGLEQGFEHTILVYAPRAVQRRRLMRRNGYSDDESDKRLEAQMDIEAKRDQVTFLVDNSGDLTRTEAEVDRVWQRLTLAEAKNYGEQVA